MCRTRYLALFFFCYLLESKAAIPQPPRTDSCSTAFCCRFSHQDKALKEFPTYRYLAAVEVYLSFTNSPYIPSTTPNYFITQLHKRNTKYLIRNGSLAPLEQAFHRYKSDLDKLKQLTNALGVALGANKKHFNQLEGEQICDWSLVRQMRKSLWKSFRQFKRALSIAYETEVVLLAQYLHNPCLFEALNGLDNLDGSALPIYVYARPSLFDSKPQLTAPQWYGRGKSSSRPIFPQIHPVSDETTPAL